MSTFAVNTFTIKNIENHTNADTLDIIYVGDYLSIVKKGQFATGDKAIYIPEGAIVPDNILRDLNLVDDAGKGKLSGSNGNVVKAIKLRGILSQGIVIKSFDTSLPDGQDVKLELNITKFEPQIPVHMSGEVFNAGVERTIKFDIENIKMHPTIFEYGEEVIFTEKIHGTCTIVGLLPDSLSHPELFGEKNNIIIFSKGLGEKGIAFKTNANNDKNLYITATKTLVGFLEKYSRKNSIETPFFICCETFGKGVQDLTYENKIAIRVFAVTHGYRTNLKYMNWHDMELFISDLTNSEIKTVPVVYHGAFSKEALDQHTNGKTTFSNDHIREGIVIVPVKERTDPRIGRVSLKSVSEKYLLRKHGTEFN